MKPLLFLAEAVREIEEAGEHYLAIAPKLASRFFAEVEVGVKLLTLFPRSGTPLTSQLRKRSLRVFPYHLIYADMEASILVLAFAHQSRKPYYWRPRV